MLADIMEPSSSNSEADRDPGDGTNSQASGGGAGGSRIFYITEEELMRIRNPELVTQISAKQDLYNPRAILQDLLQKHPDVLTQRDAVDDTDSVVNNMSSRSTGGAGAGSYNTGFPGSGGIPAPGTSTSAIGGTSFLISTGASGAVSSTAQSKEHPSSSTPRFNISGGSASNIAALIPGRQSASQLQPPPRSSALNLDNLSADTPGRWRTDMTPHYSGVDGSPAVGDYMEAANVVDSPYSPERIAPPRNSRNDIRGSPSRFGYTSPNNHAQFGRQLQQKLDDLPPCHLQLSGEEYTALLQVLSNDSLIQKHSVLSSLRQTLSSSSAAVGSDVGGFNGGGGADADRSAGGGGQANYSLGVGGGASASSSSLVANGSARKRQMLQQNGGKSSYLANAMGGSQGRAVRDVNPAFGCTPPGGSSADETADPSMGGMGRCRENATDGEMSVAGASAASASSAASGTNGSARQGSKLGLAKNKQNIVAPPTNSPESELVDGLQSYDDVDRELRIRTTRTSCPGSDPASPTPSSSFGGFSYVSPASWRSPGDLRTGLKPPVSSVAETSPASSMKVSSQSHHLANLPDPKLVSALSHLDGCGFGDVAPCSTEVTSPADPEQIMTGGGFHPVSSSKHYKPLGIIRPSEQIIPEE
ncbi:unnamed protein product [Amoebophrya sp. A25]|nr:unnamed protein product [Amoebophrya sp. A25]|eukprot:GSA25T00006174001.1